MLTFTLYGGESTMLNNNFGLHLKEIRNDLHLTQLDVSKKLGISRQAYSNYEQGLRIPDADTLAELSVILDTNLFMYFMKKARTNMQTDEFSATLRLERQKKGISQKEAADLLNIAPSSYKSYESGQRIPRLETLIEISDFYQLKPLDLIGTLLTPQKESMSAEFIRLNKVTPEKLSAENIQLLSNYNKLNIRQKEIVNSLINTFL